MDSDTINHLFVYGTLRRSFQHPLAELLARHAKFVGRGIFQGRLYDLGSYPGVISSDNAADRVHGDVYELHQASRLLGQLDYYEEYHPGRPQQSLYLRKAVSIAVPAQPPLQAWIYLYNRSIQNQTWIESGDYLAYLGCT
jgi:gamma-glutamylcyclotransferase (GGCT)/AIG2-like uncharacterized protein YtfP